MITNMPSHCIFAMDKVKKISKKQGNFETQFGQSIRNQIEPVNKNKSYNKKDIWSVKKGKKIGFICRALGIKILIDSTWNLSVSDYDKRQSMIIINPPALKNKKGKEIHYTIIIGMKTANDKDKLDDYIKNFVSKYPNKTKINFSNKYDKLIAYKIIDKTVYHDIGYEHLYMIGIERESPKYPGLILENPVTLPQGDSTQVSYCTFSNSKNRFKGKIFYVIMFDSCGDISEQSLKIFKTLFKNQIIIDSEI